MGELCRGMSFPWGFKASRSPSITTFNQSIWQAYWFWDVSVMAPTPADNKEGKMSEQHRSIEHGWRGKRGNKKPKPKQNFHPQYHKAVGKRNWGEVKVIAKMEYTNLSTLATDLDTWILAKADCVWCFCYYLHNIMSSFWIEINLKKMPYICEISQYSNKPEYQWFITSDRFYLLCAVSRSADLAMKGYTFNLHLEEDKSMMQKLCDRYDTNKYWVHFQSAD